MNSCRPTGATDGGLSIGVGVTLGSGTGVELGSGTKVELGSGTRVELGIGVVETAITLVVLISCDGAVVEVTIAGADVVGGGEGSPTSIPEHKNEIKQQKGLNTVPFLTHMSLE